MATKLVQSFSEDPKKTGIDDFMRELLEFLKRFDRAQRENTARELKVRTLSKKQRARGAELKTKKVRASGGKPGDNLYILPLFFYFFIFYPFRTKRVCCPFCTKRV